MKSRWPFVFGCLIVVSLLLLWAFTRTNHQPTYAGKSLQEWSAQLERSHRRDYPLWPTDLESSQQAIRAIGTNALPFFMAEIQARPSLMDRLVGRLMRLKLVQKLGFSVGPKRRTNVDHWKAGIHVPLCGQAPSTPWAKSPLCRIERQAITSRRGKIPSHRDAPRPLSHWPM